jgi:glucose/arabinose dehydrogenase
MPARSCGSTRTAVSRRQPVVGRDGYLPEILTLGHRTPLGLAVPPGTGQIWETENGPNGGDEGDVLVPGGNYGWPIVSLGRTYPGALAPIAVSGLAVYTGDRLPKWKGDVFVGGLRTGEIIGRCRSSAS